MRLQPAGRNIVAALVAAGPDGLTPGELAEEVYGDALGPNWEQNLRKAISRVRKAMEIGSIESRGGRYAFTLDAAAIDVWRLMAYRSLDLSLVDRDELRSLVADRPYPGIDLRSIAQAMTEVDVARAGLVTRLIDEVLDRVDDALLTAAAEMARVSWHEPLLCAVVDLHIAAQRRSVAADLARSAVVRLEDQLGVHPGSELSRRAEQLAEDDLPDIDAPPPAATWIGPAPRSPGHASIDRLELMAALDDALAAGTALLTGASGTGKTALAASLARDRHEHGNHVVWVAGQRGSSAAYGPLAAAVPAIFDAVAAVDDGLDEGVIETRRWASIRRAFDVACPERTITLVVDDVQWLDSHTTRFLEFLARSSTQELELLLVGRPDDDLEPWQELVDRLRRSAVAEVSSSPFTHDQLVELVGRIHPQSTNQQRTELATLLISSKGDLPLVAADAIASADPDTLALPDLTLLGGQWSDLVWTSAVSRQTAEIAAVAALVGVTWSFGDALALLGDDVVAEELSDAIDELLDADLLVAESRPDRFSFRHVLVQEAFEGVLEHRRRRAFHQAAAKFAWDDGRVHDRARHMVAAGPSVPVDAVVEAIVASARAHLDERSWLESVRAFAVADRIDADALDARSLGRYADAIQQSGGDAVAMRNRAFAAAEALDDPHAMFDVIAETAESSEVLESDGHRLALLDRVPGDRLSARERFSLETMLCRELGLAGQQERARGIFESLSATTTNERAAAWMAVWTSIVGTPIATWPPLEFDVEAVDDPVYRARVRNVLAERALALGDRAAFDASLAALEAEPAMTEHRVRSWQLHLILSVRHFIDGEFTTATAVADKALGIGLEHGLAGAFPARAAQLFADRWLVGRHGDLLPLLDGAAPDVRTPLLAEAARAAALFTQPDRIDDAREAAAAIFQRLDTSTLLTHATIASLFSDSGPLLSAQQRQRLRAILEPHANHAVAMSAGIAHLGPARRSLAHLAERRDDTIALLRLAIADADAWQLPVWSLRCRLDLHRVTGDAAPLEEATTLAAGTEMATAFSLA